MNDALLEVAELLRDRLDSSGVRRVATRLLGLRLVAGRDSVPDWDTIIDGGLPAAERALTDLATRDPRLGTDPLPELPADRVRAVLRALGRIDPADDDVLGEAFTHLLGLLARAEGRRGGQFYTPPCLRTLLASLVPVQDAVVYDPCCGSGGLLVEAAHAGAARVVGQELNPATRELAAWNGLLHGLDVDLGPSAGDTLRQDLHPGLRADAVLANPPFNTSRWGDEELARSDARFAWGKPSLRNANFAWLQHILSHLAEGGRAAVILTSGSLAGRDLRERALREALVHDDRVEAIIALPDQLFHNTVIGACVWVLGRARGRVLFADLREAGRMEDRASRVLDPEDLAPLLDALGRHRDGEDIDAPGLARSVPAGELDEDLTPGRWIRPSLDLDGVLDVDAAVQRVVSLTRQAQRLDRTLLHALAGLQDEHADDGRP